MSETVNDIRFELDCDVNGQFYGRAVFVSTVQIAMHSESYVNRADCVHMLDQVARPQVPGIGGYGQYTDRTNPDEVLIRSLPWFEHATAVTVDETDAVDETTNTACCSEPCAQEEGQCQPTPEEHAGQGPAEDIG